MSVQAVGGLCWRVRGSDRPCREVRLRRGMCHDTVRRGRDIGATCFAAFIIPSFVRFFK